MGIATSAFIQKTSMKFLLFAVLLFIHAELQHCGKKYLVETADKGNKYDDDYRLTVDGDVLKSKFDTASDHEVRVKGNMKWTKAHNYGGAKGGKNDGLRVDGNVYKSDVDTADEHNASVGGSILNSNIHNYGGKKYEKPYKPYGKYD